MTSGAIILAERCNWCSRQVSPSDLTKLSTGQAMCTRCREWHLHALQVLSGEATPQGCQHCGLSLATLNDLTNSPTTRMYVVPMDGLYALLCATCKEEYCRKRADLYKGTRFGEELKL